MTEPSGSDAASASGNVGQTQISGRRKGRPANVTTLPDQSKNEMLTKMIQQKEEEARAKKDGDVRDPIPEAPRSTEAPKPLEITILRDVIARVKRLSNFNFNIEDFNGWRVALMKIQEAVRDYA